MAKRIAVGLLLAWVAVWCLAGSAEAAKLKYENLVILGGTNNYGLYCFMEKQAGINDAGQVVGVSYTAAGTLHAFVKSPEQAMQDLGALIPGSGESHAHCINPDRDHSRGYYPAIP